MSLAVRISTGSDGFLRSDVAQHLEPGSAGQHQIEHDRVVVDRARLLAGAVAVVQHIDGVAFLLEPGLDEAGDLPIVFNDEDAHRALRLYPDTIRTLALLSPRA